MATYKFTLTTEDGTITFGADKVSNWSDIKPSLVVNDTYRGVFREFTNTFNFIGEPRTQIIKAIDTYGYDTEIYLTIDVGDDNGSRQSYKTIAYMLKAETQDIEINNLDVALNFVDSGFVGKVMNREDVAVNLDATESLDGETITVPEKLLWDVELHDRMLTFNSKYTQDDYSGTYQQSDDMGSQLFFPFPVTADYNTGDSPSALILTLEDYSNLQQTPLLAVIDKSTYGANGTIKINTKGTVKFTQRSGSEPYLMEYVVVLMLLYSEERRAEEGRWAEPIQEFDTGLISSFDGTDTINIDISGEYGFSLQEGDSLLFGVTLLKRYAVTTFNMSLEMDYNNVFISVISSFPSTTAKAMLPHELFTQLLRIYTGKETPFYSEFFGRKDLGYSQDGEGAYLAIMTGKMIRGFPWGAPEDEDDPRTVINTSFKDAFEALSAIYNLGATIEDIGNDRRLRIEPMDYFRQMNVVADIGDILSEPSRQIAQDYMFNNVKVGYENQEYEELNGLYAYNGEFGFSVPFQGDGDTLDIVSKWRADDLGIELTRRQQYSNDPTIDYRSDDDIFVIDCKKHGDNLNAFIVNNEFSLIEGIFEPERAYNLKISPKRNFYRWQEEIKACVLFKPDSDIKYIKGPNNPSLKTQISGENEIDEDADVEVSALKNPKFLPEILMISEAPLTLEQWENIKTNKTGVIKFTHRGVTLFGYIRSIEFDINRKTANFELLRANM